MLDAEKKLFDFKTDWKLFSGKEDTINIVSIITAFSFSNIAFVDCSFFVMLINIHCK